MFFGIVIIFFFFNMFGLVSKMKDTIKNKKIVEDKITELEKSKEKLNSDIDSLKTDEGVEKNIREKFGLAKEGENMIMIIDDKNQTIVEEEPNDSVFWGWLKNLFK